MLGMSNDLFLEHIRTYLREYFGEVEDDRPQGDYYVLKVTVNGTARELKAHRNLMCVHWIYPAVP
jgi:hypothetical protein